jgi:hypothetical protein
MRRLYHECAPQSILEPSLWNDLSKRQASLDSIQPPLSTYPERSQANNFVTIENDVVITEEASPLKFL